MNFALLNFVLSAVRDSCPLVCIASSKILFLLRNCVALIQVVKNLFSSFVCGVWFFFPGTWHDSAVC